MTEPTLTPEERARKCYDAMWTDNGTHSEESVIAGIARAIREALAEFTQLKAAELARLRAIKEAAKNYISKRHHSNCGMSRFSDKDKRHCTCGRDKLSAALEAK